MHKPIPAKAAQPSKIINTQALTIVRVHFLQHLLHTEIVLTPSRRVFIPTPPEVRYQRHHLRVCGLNEQRVFYLQLEYYFFKQLNTSIAMPDAKHIPLAKPHFTQKIRRHVPRKMHPVNLRRILAQISIALRLAGAVHNNITRVYRFGFSVYDEIPRSVRYINNLKIQPPIFPDAAKIFCYELLISAAIHNQKLVCFFITPLVSLFA